MTVKEMMDFLSNHIAVLDKENLDLKNSNERLREALEIAINTVECDSYGFDSKGNKFELPWYRAAKSALSQEGARG